MQTYTHTHTHTCTLTHTHTHIRTNAYAQHTQRAGICDTHIDMAMFQYSDRL